MPRSTVGALIIRGERDRVLSCPGGELSGELPTSCYAVLFQARNTLLFDQIAFSWNG